MTRHRSETRAIRLEGEPEYVSDTNGTRWRRENANARMLLYGSAAKVAPLAKRERTRQPGRNRRKRVEQRGHIVE